MIESGISHTFACRSLSEHVINAGLYRAASLTVEVKTKRRKKFKLYHELFFFWLKKLFLDADADGILLHDEENIIPNALVTTFLSIFAISIDVHFFTPNNDIKIYTGASAQSARHLISTTMCDGARRTMCV